ncbi:MAG: hypothetical protein HND27_03890 [Bacteroidetes bacterium]|nr:hypothetical protein [Bacteroidota bacterium]MBV6460227.1 hypothetical protein [Flavobacteriales bacterium]WKZ74595.1 MAG: hypothetical protein QY303_10625 [Vicingaceae bacterium]MCL4816861.1 hypothetical protein [Flavobacteriales bacterium]NOG94902.1 hypothetical protein [Bacteroidota bacterium]
MKKIFGTFLALLTSCILYSQNVAINATGATANASAMLDVTSTTSGVLIPRMTQAQRNAIGTPATSLLIYQTDGTSGYYYYNGSIWVPLFSNNTGWSITGNTGTNPATNFLGTTDNQALVLRTNNTERMRVLGTGRIGVNTLTIEGTIDARDNFASSIGNYATSLQINTNATGTGFLATGQNSILNGLVAGSGGSVTGVTNGLYVYYTTPGVGQAEVLQDGFGAQWLVGYWSGTQYRKIIGNGTVSTIIKDLNNEYVVLNCIETPENLFQDFGIGKLENGKTFIKIDPILSKNIIVNEEHPLKVFIQLEGDCNGVYVKNKTSEGFEVIELNGGTSNISFSYSLVATRGNEEYYGQDGTKRIAKYNTRFDKAPSRIENIVESTRKK